MMKLVDDSVKPMPTYIRVFWPGTLYEGWVSGDKIVFEDKNMRPVRIEPNESVLEAIHRVFGKKCIVEVF